MGHSDRILLLVRLIPFSVWKDGLLERHLERCPGCAARLASREEARRLLVHASDLGGLEGIWPAVREAIAAPGPRRPDAIRNRIPAWRWMTAAAGLALAVFLTWAAVRALLPGHGMAGFDVVSVAEFESEAGPPAGDVQLGYVRIDNEPARAIIYKPHDSNLVLIWAGRN
jgi:anti-sigma factor RsiW